MNVAEKLYGLQSFFNSGATHSYSFRKEQLKKLRSAIRSHEQEIYDALYSDLKKSKEEAWVTEIGIALAELRYTLKNLSDWMEPERASTNLLNMPSSSRIISEPLGTVLVIAPWNYPFQLSILPLIGAIAGGNCVVVKPSEFASATAEVIAKIIEETFEPNYILCVNGDGQAVIPAMLNAIRFDHIFYTGSTAVGKIIYKQAAETLTPVTLELGGKSPCVVESDANIAVAAKRIALAKFTNAGQTCVAPDYILVHESKKQALIEALKKSIQEFFGEAPKQSDGYGKIINEKQFNRIASYLKEGVVAYGGKTDKETLFISPTLLTDVSVNDAVMKEEIFGPVLPVLSYAEKEEALRIIEKNPNPLSFYIYTSSSKKEKEWLQAVPAGGACINNSSVHVLNHHLPFGGRGASGIGNYHGKNSFNTFTHKKAVLKTPTWLDPSMKYPPFKGKLNLFKWIIR